MKTILFLILIIILIYSAGNYILGGGLQKYIDTHQDKPQVIKYQMSLANIYFFLGKYEKAIVGYENIVNRYPQAEQVPEALYRLGQSYDELSRYPEAREVYKKLIENYPGNEHLPEVQSRLNYLLSLP